MEWEPNRPGSLTYTLTMIKITRNAGGIMSTRQEDMLTNLENLAAYIEALQAGTPTETIPTGSIAANAVTTAKLAVGTIQTAEVLITKANILAMYAAPVEVVATPGTGKVLEFVSATLIYDRNTATYGGGGDVTINYSSAGAAVSNTVVKTDCFGAAGDKVFYMGALNLAGGYTMPVNTGLSITNATGAFTDPGTAAGVARLKITYRVHTTDL